MQIIIITNTIQDRARVFVPSGIQPEKLHLLSSSSKRWLQFKGGRINPHFFQPANFGSRGPATSQNHQSLLTTFIYLEPILQVLPQLNVPPELVIKTNPEVGDMNHEILLFRSGFGILILASILYTSGTSSSPIYPKQPGFPLL